MGNTMRDAEVTPIHIPPLFSIQLLVGQVTSRLNCSYSREILGDTHRTFLLVFGRGALLLLVLPLK